MLKRKLATIALLLAVVMTALGLRAAQTVSFADVPTAHSIAADPLCPNGAPPPPGGGC